MHDAICCPACTYSLRGTPARGDVLRCSECGTWATRDAVHLAARRRLSRLERARQDGTFALGLAVCGLLLAIIWERASGAVTPVEFTLAMILVTAAYLAARRWRFFGRLARAFFAMGIGLQLIAFEALQPLSRWIPLVWIVAMAAWTLAFHAQATHLRALWLDGARLSDAPERPARRYSSRTDSPSPRSPTIRRPSA